MLGFFMSEGFHRRAWRTIILDRGVCYKKIITFVWLTGFHALSLCHQ